MSRGSFPYSILLKEENTVADKNNAVCCICGRGYHKCLSCKDYMRLQPWKDVTDTAECYKVFQVVRGYSTGVYNEDEFKSRLKNIDLSNLEGFRDHIKTLIVNALKEDEPVVETVVEEAVETVVEPVYNAVITEEAVVVEKPVVSRKRSYKVNDEVVETE